MFEQLSSIIEIAFFLMFYGSIHSFAMNVGATRLEKQKTIIIKKSNFFSRRILPLFDSTFLTREAILLALVVSPFAFLYLHDSFLKSYQ